MTPMTWNGVPSSITDFPAMEGIRAKAAPPQGLAENHDVMFCANLFLGQKYGGQALAWRRVPGRDVGAEHSSRETFGSPVPSW
jgi:hypothetical protein